MRMRIRLIHGRLAQIRNSPKVIADLQSRAERIAAAAGDGVATRPPETGSGERGRARVAIVTETFDAARREATSRDLTRAIDAGR